MEVSDEATVAKYTLLKAAYSLTCLTEPLEAAALLVAADAYKF